MKRENHDAIENSKRIEGKVQMSILGKEYIIRVEEEETFRTMNSKKHLE